MFEYYDNILCVQGGWLYNEAEIMTKYNYDVLKKRGWLNLVRRGGNGRASLVSFDSIPDRFKKVIIQRPEIF